MNSIKVLLGNRILIEPIGERGPQSSLIHIPETVQKLKVPFGRVVLKGTQNQRSLREKRAAALMGDVNVGDFVRVDNQMGSGDCLYQGKPHRIVSILDVQAVVPATVAAVLSVEMVEN